MGLSTIVAITISFMPAEKAKEVPATLRPILCDGFVMGVFIILRMEHLIFRKKSLGNN
jgi:uracil permease